MTRGGGLLDLAGTEIWERKKGFSFHRGELCDCVCACISCCRQQRMSLGGYGGC